ncbi:MAG: GMP synthase [Bacteroidia bacterium]
MQQIKIAILDMYKGAPNQGMRNIHQILENYSLENNIEIYKKVYDVREKHEIPDLAYDAYISTGGPGSPVENEGWEEAYMSFIHALILYNETTVHKKFLFLICHSFQVFCYQFKLARVCLRQSESFGIFPVHKTYQGAYNTITHKLQEPFYAVDSRKWQVIQPDAHALRTMGAKILAIEKERIHVPHERATMAIQFTQEIIGTQFHPEADAQGMIFYLNGEEKKNVVIENYGIEKYNSFLSQLHEPGKISHTQKIILPSFVDEVVKMLNIN